MAVIFISYRREDSWTAAALIDRELTTRFGNDQVFLDSRSILAGADFVEELLGRLRACRVLLVVIGAHWLSLTDATGQRRIDDPNDWIRREIIEAFANGLRVIPVLIDNVTLPTKADLPTDIAGLSRRHYVPLRSRYTSIDLGYLVERIAESDQELAKPLQRTRRRFVALGLTAMGLAIAPVVVSDGTRRPRGKIVPPGDVQHTAGVKTVAYSPNGQILATGGDDRTIILRNPHTGETIAAPLTGHADAVESLVFSHDNKLLISASSDGTVRFWDPIVGTPITRPAEIRHQRRVRSVAISPDGRLIATGSEDSTIQLWDLTSGRPVGRSFTDHTATVKSIAFSRDGKILASGSDDNTLRLWDVITGQPIGQPHEDHDNYVETVGFSPDGKLLASGGDDSTVRLWHPLTGQTIGNPLRGHEDYVRGLAFSPNSEIIATASGDHTVRLWDAATNLPLGVPLIGHMATVRSVAFSPDGKFLASGGMDHAVLLWAVS